MNTFLVPDHDSLVEKLASMLDFKEIEIQRIGGGKNSQVYKIRCDHRDDFAVKRYFQHHTDKRDRLKNEYTSLQFLWRNGVTCVPQPITFDREAGLAVYEFIEGEKIPSDKVNQADIDEAVRFLSALSELRQSDGSLSMSSASEASFTISDIVQNINNRLDRLLTVPTGEIYAQELMKFLNEGFIPLLDEVVMWCKNECRGYGISFTDIMPQAERTLSPSDFGFHNALKRQFNGIITFIDFEYFGWDDPAKMVCDFLLHPAMDLHSECYERFASGIFDAFQSTFIFVQERSILVYPLYGLKWVMIILNEFLSSGLQRHQFVQPNPQNREIVLSNQLSKAISMLERVRHEYKSPSLLMK